MNAVMKLGKFLGGCKSGGPSRRTQLLGVT
jgi:hypothetical protein